METQNLNHFQNQHKRFLSFIKVLVDKFKPEQIYSFGKNYALNEIDSCFVKHNTNGQYHYFLLMVTESRTKIEHEVQDFVNSKFGFGSMTVLVHGKEIIAEALAGNNRFFNTVCSKGQIVYSQNGMVEPEFISPFIPTQSAEKALKHLYHRMELANGFLAGADECLNNDHFNVCTFMLHQVVEQACIALIRVHLAYRCELHNLQRLLRLCKCFSDKPIKMLLSGTTEDERLFDILLTSYSGARYRDNFDVSREDAELLFYKISAFLTLAKVMCNEKIEALTKEVEVYKEQNQESEASHE
ncbi:HEPN domain-containing protein [Pedobacter cryoconitis]|uniref:HEPN domain-containing protein n=1 Tax=Pedobacter cryoconitis TaxID=188932 RepID=A0A7W8YSE3_9SPHI|nr:HEPN domain-containing protein [Pedobacter cryoconitis]MBB5620973.1 HEPN domain-containing protein [Pedobacter cryoconitis]